MTAGAPPPQGDPELTDDEIRAAYEAELQRIRVEDVLVQTVVSLLNLGARKAGLVPGREGEPDPGERDFGQVRLAIEGVRALLPLVETALGPDAKAVRDALSQLQIVYARSGAQAPAAAQPPPSEEKEEPAAPGSDKKQEPAEPGPGEPGPAQASGRLWVPGR